MCRTQPKRCALVTSGGSIEGTGWGAAIDAFDVVVRLNNAPARKFEKDVGSRTDLCYTNGFYEGDREDPAEAVIAGKWCDKVRAHHNDCRLIPLCYTGRRAAARTRPMVPSVDCCASTCAVPCGMQASVELCYAVSACAVLAEFAPGSPGWCPMRNETAMTLPTLA